MGDDRGGDRDAGDDAGEDAGKDAAEDAGKDAAEDAGKDAAEDAGPDAGDDGGPQKDVADDQGEDGGAQPDGTDPPDLPADTAPPDEGSPDENVPECTDGFLRCEGSTLVTCVDGSEVAQACGAPGCNAQARRCNACVPGTQSCSNGTLRVCGPDGLLTETPCTIGCAAGGMRCTDIDPSNGLATYLDQAGTNRLAPEAGAMLTVDTDRGTITCAAPSPCGVTPSDVEFDLAVQPPGAPTIGVFSFEAVTIPAGTRLRVVGTRALAIVASGDVRIDGEIDLRPPDVIVQGGIVRGGHLPGPGGRLQRGGVGTGSCGWSPTPTSCSKGAAVEAGSEARGARVAT